MKKIQGFALFSGEWLIVVLGFVLPLSTAATNVVMGALILCWFFGPWKSQLRMGLNHTLVRAFGVLFLSALMALSYTHASWSQGTHSLYEVSKGLCLLFLLPFCQKSLTTSRAQQAFLVAMGITFILGVLKVAGLITLGEKFSQAAVFKNHIVTSYFMAFSAYWLADYAYREKAYRYLAMVGCAAAMFYVFILNVGRTGHVMLLVLMLTYMVQHWRWKGLYYGLPLLGALVLGVSSLSDHFSMRFGSLLDLGSLSAGSDISLIYRLEFAKTSFWAALEHPWFGWGTGAFETAYRSMAAPIGQMMTDNPHNQYLMTWVETGLVGLVLLALVFYRIWQLCLRLPRERQALAQALLISFVVGCLGNSLLKDFSEHFFFLSWVAFLFSTTPSVYGPIRQVEVAPLADPETSVCRPSFH